MEPEEDTSAADSPDPTPSASSSSSEPIALKTLQRLGLSRLSVKDVRDRLAEEGVQASYSTVWRWLHRPAIRPWFHRGWLFPRDPAFRQKGSVVVDLYHGLWQGKPLPEGSIVLSADEKTCIQILERVERPLEPGEKRRGRHPFKHKKHGTRCYISFLNVQTGTVFGSVFERNSAENFDTALMACLTQPEMAGVKQVFLIVDNGSVHHPSTFQNRVNHYKELGVPVTVVHLPTNASWLNQVEQYFSIVTRKALTPRNLKSGKDLELRLAAFEKLFNTWAKPFHWKFSRENLNALLDKLATKANGWVEGAVDAGEEEFEPELQLNPVCT